jgi:hypothetical protein
MSELLKSGYKMYHKEWTTKKELEFVSRLGFIRDSMGTEQDIDAPIEDTYIPNIDRAYVRECLEGYIAGCKLREEENMWVDAGLDGPACEAAARNRLKMW